MKKYLSILLVLVLSLAFIVGCQQTDAPPADGNNQGEEELVKIIVGASPEPHAEILAAVKDQLAEKGYELVIKEFVDYIQPNMAVENNELDANFFQHKPYLDDFNEENKTNLVSVAAIHYEPLGIYPGKTASLEELADGATVAVPNDSTNEARALLLLEGEGLIKIKEDAGFTATVNDIIENPKNLKVKEIEAAQLARSLPDVDIAVINGNYALQAGLDVEKDALAKEEEDSVAAETYANIVAIRAGEENREEIKALIEVLMSDDVKSFIKEKYEGSVVPKF